MFTLGDVLIRKKNQSKIAFGFSGKSVVDDIAMIVGVKLHVTMCVCVFAGHREWW